MASLWHIRWDPEPRAWLHRRLGNMPLERRRRVRMTLDRSLQQIAQFPESGGWTGGRYPESRLLSERHRVLNVGDMLLFYYLDETSQTIIVTNMQTTAQDIPAPEIFARQ